MESKGNSHAKFGIHSFDCCVRLGQAEPGAQRLQSEMVLLIYHDAQLVPEKHRSPGPDRMLGVETRQFLADQVSLMQQEAIGRRQLVHPNKHSLLESGRSVHGVLYMC